MNLSDLLYHAFTHLGAEIVGSAEDIARGEMTPATIFIEGDWSAYRSAESILSGHGIDSWGKAELLRNFRFSVKAKLADDAVHLLRESGIRAWRG